MPLLHTLHRWAVLFSTCLSLLWTPQGAHALATRADEVWVLVLGQSLSANCNQQMFGPVEDVFQVSLTGALIPAKDPFVWADCKGGSVWMPLGERLIQSGRAKKVVFMPIGMADTKVGDWLPSGKAYPKLSRALALIQAQGFRFDYAFWLQGSSDGGLAADVYEQRLDAVLKSIDSQVSIGKWVIAQHAKCYGWTDPNIANAQRKLAAQRQLRRYPGPTTHALSDTLRSDKCHLNQSGQRALAEAWLNSLQQIDGTR